MNKTDLIHKLKQLEGLTPDEKATLINLVNTNKKYGLVWEDKPEDVEEKLRKNLPVLREVVEKRILGQALPKAKAEDQTLFDNPENQTNHKNHSSENYPNHILIEGDNLHALTALTFTHEGKIDVIYIDPPYNTGNKDFRYNDSFVDKEDTYRHSKWLSFMNKRLQIAKKLLSDKGVVFISIDDYEQATLKLLCDEIFTEMNFVGNVIWQRAYAPINLKKTISQNHDFILIYCKQSFQTLKFNGLPRTEKQNKDYKNPDNDPRGLWKVGNPSVGPAVPKNIYEVVSPSGRKTLPPKGRSWLYTREKLNGLIADNRIWFGKDNNSIWAPKLFLSEVSSGVTPMSLWTYEEVGHTQDGKKELKEILFETETPFETVKPIKLIDRVLKLVTDSNKKYTILDFFAGSGTTLNALIKLNIEDGGNRQCILVTNNENNICEEVTYERNKRVIQGYTNAKGEAVAGLTNNNLRYYKSDFVPSNKTDQNKRLLTQASTELLCIKEDCYKDITKANGFNEKQCKLFTNEKCKYLVVVYHSRNQLEVCEQLITFIKTIDTSSEKVRLYSFSPEKETLVEDFYEVADKIEAVPLPEAIYNAYRATFKILKLDKKAAVLKTTESTETEATLFDNNEAEA
jgi:adenine-specific DNA-methyltransferase